MTVVKTNLGLVLFALALLPACGNPGAPLPPSLELAEPVRDLHATRKGDRVTLSWTPPAKTTERRNLRHLGPTQVCRSTNPAEPCATVIAQLQTAKAQSPGSTQQMFTDQLRADSGSAAPTAMYVYAVRVLNSYGKTAGPSNYVEIPDAPTLAPPSNFSASLGSQGVTLKWDPARVPSVRDNLRFVYRVYRRDTTSNALEIAGELPVGDSHPVFLDHAFAWERTYDYYLTAVTIISDATGSEKQVEGDNTPTATIVAQDVFPPSVPTGLQAVFSGAGQKSFIDLVWSPNTDADLAGYNVYRHEPGTSPQKVNADVIKTPAFRDSNVVSGHEYSYSISAVDVRGNESVRSEEASETVPRE